MELNIFTEEIKKTGFVLENNVAVDLKSEGWMVISNKYYEDDLEGTVREIDLLAYKVSKFQHINVYTTLLISCKKSEQNVWALLARDINLNDPNVDWWPLHTWSNDRVISHELAEAGISRSYHEEMKSFGVLEALSISDFEVFAFQEMKKAGGSPQNDKNIFNAVTSLMKAQAYELSSLPERKKVPVIYQFNLVSVIDSELVRLRFSNAEIKAQSVDSEHYIARYIIKKKQSFSRVRFITAKSFKLALSDYNRLHDGNCRWFKQTHERYYANAVKDQKRMKVLIDDFRAMLRWTLPNRIERQFKVKYDIKIIDLDWKSEENRLAVTLPASEISDIFPFLNSDEESTKLVKNALKNVYQYEGEFYFTVEDIPF